MNPLVKKEIRLLLPSWLAVLLLEIFLPWFLTDPDTSFAGTPLFVFFGMIILAVDSFGRESSLGTFQSLLAQPMERRQIWRTKITVLFSAAVLIFAGFFISCAMMFHHALSIPVWGVNPGIIGKDFRNAMLGSGVVMVIALVGGLWTTLLLRQAAAAFWITFLAPAGLLMLIILFLPSKLADDEHVVFSLLYSAAGIYIVAGFWFAHRLFHRAQDAAWTGGVIAFSKWRYYESGSQSSVSTRQRRPIAALVKKELQLQSITWFCAAVLLALHLAVIVIRKVHGSFERDSIAGGASEIFWTLWLVMPLIIGGTAVAEERRLGVTEGQFCLPASRRFQFAVKFFPALFFGILLGGCLPLLLETCAAFFGAPNPDFNPLNQDHVYIRAITFFLALALGLSLVGLFASALTKSFLQALGAAVVIIVGCVLFASFAGHFRSFLGNAWNPPLTLGLMILTTLIVVPWLTYRNFNCFQERGRVWRRNVMALTAAILFIFISSAALYNRVWEVFEPAEPAHGPAKLSLSNPPTLRMAYYQDLLVRLPDGRVWFDILGDSPSDYYDYSVYDGSVQWKYLWRTLMHPLPRSIGQQQFLAGSNWVAATVEHMYFSWDVSGERFFASGFMDTVGIQPDGTLWISEKPATNQWTPGKLQQFGSETNWRQLAQDNASVVLLKSDGTLWRWGLLTNRWSPKTWPGLRAFTPYQIDSNSDWQALFTMGWIYAKRTDGRVWRLAEDWKNGKEELERKTNYDEVILQTASRAGDDNTVFVRADGTLWVLNRYWDQKRSQTMGTGILEVGKENDWRAVALSYDTMVALKADGSLWQWNFKDGNIVRVVNDSPTRLGIHDDWVAITGTWNDVIALAADGSLWLWPDRKQYEQTTLLKLPKQPKFLGNVFGKAD
jgi:ABC-type transport system involved in multi-copper enzyme maturation permease subunit